MVEMVVVEVVAIVGYVNRSHFPDIMIMTSPVIHCHMTNPAPTTNNGWAFVRKAKALKLG
jgi:hypothetical protein